MLGLPHKAFPLFLAFYNFLREMVNLPWGYTAFCSVKYKRLAQHYLKLALTSSYQRRTESGSDEMCLCSFNAIHIKQKNLNCIIFLILPDMLMLIHQHVLSSCMSSVFCEFHCSEKFYFFSKYSHLWILNMPSVFITRLCTNALCAFAFWLWWRYITNYLV